MVNSYNSCYWEYFSFLPPTVYRSWSAMHEWQTPRKIPDSREKTRSSTEFQRSFLFITTRIFTSRRGGSMRGDWEEGSTIDKRFFLPEVKEKPPFQFWDLQSFLRGSISGVYEFWNWLKDWKQPTHGKHPAGQIKHFTGYVPQRYWKQLSKGKSQWVSLWERKFEKSRRWVQNEPKSAFKV